MEIRTKNDLSVAIEKLTSNELAFKDISVNIEQLDDDLKHFTIKFSGEHMNGTMSAPMMRAFIELQSKLNQSYSDLHHNGNIRRIKDSEREQLTLYFKVKEGTTSVEANIADILKLFIDKMTPEQVVTTTFVLGASYVLGIGVKAFFHDRATKRQQEIDKQLALESNQLKRDELAHHRELAKTTAESTATAFEQYESLTRILTDKHPESAKALAHQTEVADNLIRAGASSGSVLIGDVEVPQEALQTINETTRETSKLLRKDGAYAVRVIDATKAGVFTVEVQHLETHEQFSATVQDDTAANEYNQFIRDALGAKKPLYLRIQAKERRGKIVDAVIIEAELIGDD